MTIEEFIARRVRPEFHPLVARLRKIFQQAAPRARAELAYGIPVWRLNRIFAVLSPTRKDITVSFAHGTEFEDKYDRLRGVGKVSRHIKFKTADEAEAGLLRYYIRQALAIDAARGPHAKDRRPARSAAQVRNTSKRSGRKTRHD